MVVQLPVDTLPNEYYAEEQPMQGQYDQDDKQCENVNDATIRDNGVNEAVPESDAASQKDWPCLMVWN